MRWSAASIKPVNAKLLSDNKPFPPFIPLGILPFRPKPLAASEILPPNPKLARLPPNNANAPLAVTAAALKAVITVPARTTVFVRSG